MKAMKKNNVILQGVGNLDIEYLRNMSMEYIQTLYKTYLQKQKKGENTKQTFGSDAFYLWRKAGREVFWNIVTSDEFEADAKNALFKELTENSKSNAKASVSDYMTKLRDFRRFVYSEQIFLEEQKNFDALKEFLLDIECLEPLTEWTNKFNLFDILKITRTEIRHSNMLAWLMDPNENHGLGESVLRNIIQYVISVHEKSKDIFDALLMDYYDFTIRREWHHIDIIASSKNFVLCIENKIDSKEHDEQLSNYKEFIEEIYPSPEYSKVYVYLSPKGDASSDPGCWHAVSYKEILKIIEKEIKKVKLLPDVELLINNYIEALRREIVGDERLAQICAEIYMKHQKALDLIFANKPDRISEIISIFIKWAKEKKKENKIDFDVSYCDKTHVRFKTRIMSDILPDTKEMNSSWNTMNHYFYELMYISGNKFHIQLTFIHDDMPEEQRIICETIENYFQAQKFAGSSKGTIPFKTKSERIDSEFSADTIFKQLDGMLKKLEEFEIVLKKILKE